MIVKILLVDACADGLFSGGTAAVAFLRHLGQEVFLQALADEMGFPATVYVLPHQDEFITRCFAPLKGEINADNFAALAAAHAIYGVGLSPADKPVVLHGRGGVLTLFKDLDQPEDAVSLHLGTVRTAPAPPDLDDAPGLMKAEYLGADHLLLYCRSMAALEGSDYRRLSEAFPQTRLSFSAPLESSGPAGYAVRAFSSEAVPEAAPMCLSMHAALGSFWLNHFKKTKLEVHYISPRNCRLWIDQRPDGRLVASGHVNTVLRADPVLRELKGDIAAGDSLYDFSL